DGARPKIAEYAGRGDLASWVRVVAVRCALNGLRGVRRREGAFDDEVVMDRWSSNEDEEIRLLKVRYRAEFAEAFHAALSRLRPRERNVLRQHYVDGLAMERIAAIYGVHRITVVRWIREARLVIERETRAGLTARLRIGRSDLDSILRLIQSQV